MRGFLVLSGILVAALIAVILALPRLVDEPALRARLLAAVTTAAGWPIESAGRARLELAPLPRLSIERVRMSEPGRFRLEADRVDIDLALGALLRGRFEPGRLQLVRPVIELERLPADPLATVLAALGRGTATVQDFQIVDGSMTLAAAAGPPALPRALRAVDFGLRFEPERRRLNVQGTGELEDEPWRLEAALEPLPLAGPASLTLSLAAGAPETPITAAFQGRLEGAGGPLAGKVRVAAPQGRLPAWLARLAGGEAVGALPGGLELSGDLALSSDHLALDDLDLGLAETRARGRARIAWGSAPRVEAVLEAARAAVTPELEGVLRWLAAAVPDAPRLGGRLELRLASLTWRAGEIRRLRTVLDLAPGHRLSVPRFDAVLPGETALRWIGGEPLGAGQGIAGSLSLQAGELRAFLAWLGVPANDLPAGGLASLDLSAQTELTAERATLTALEAQLDATLVAGSLVLHRGDRPRLEAALAADRLNTALYLTGAPELAVETWRRRLAGHDLLLDLAVDRLSHDAWRDGKLSLRAAVEAGRVELTSFRLTGAGGASASARGRADLAARAFELSGELNTGLSPALLRALGMLPGPELAGLLPVSLSGRLQGDPEVASVDARINAGVTSGHVYGSLGGPFDPHFLDLAGELALPDPAALALAFGLPATPGLGLGALAADFQLTRDGGPVQVAATGQMGASELKARLGLELASPRALTLALAADTVETELLARAYQVLALSSGIPAGWPWEWPGSWPQQPLAWGWLAGPDLRLDLTADALRHAGAVLPGARGTVSLNGTRLALTGLDLPLAGGKLEGTLTLEREAEHALLGGDLRLRGARAEQVVGLMAPGSGLAGRLDLGARLLARGRSIADLVRSLEGEGDLALRDGQLTGVPFPPGVGPAPPLEPVVAVPLLRGPLQAARGVVTSGGPGLEFVYGGGTGTARLRFDLLAWLLDVALEGRTPEVRELRLIGAPGRLRPVAP